MRRFELTYPYIFAFIFGVIVFLKDWSISEVKNFDAILNSSVTVSSIVIAFLGTMISILISLTNAEIMQRIFEHKGDSDLTSYVKTSIIFGLILAVYSMFLYVMIDSTGLFSKLLLVLFVMLLTIFILSSYRVIQVVSKILSAVLEESKRNTKTQPAKIYVPKIKSSQEDNKVD
ncbi:hypothetical protein CHR37_07410 [Bacillus velezensis]|uniref:hypothetical protein n=1 Tax=Bacillus TaxID=1386 RepID=UPI000B93CAE7|nr:MULTISPECIES: hypothetical protein [Bacillus]MCX2735672.1 hypothetical protein [Bacillus sp. AnS8]OYD12750.1 hypothetical protein CHR37_07410 [Bacillus velezensis]